MENQKPIRLQKLTFKKKAGTEEKIKKFQDIPAINSLMGSLEWRLTRIHSRKGSDQVTPQILEDFLS